MIRLFLLVLLIATFSVAFSVPVAALDLDSRQSKVWAKEEAYWHFASSGNVEEYVGLWHDKFVGWPCSSWTPAGKANIGAWVERIRDNHWTLSYALKPEAVRLFGNVAVVHYAAELALDFGDGTTKGAREWRKFVHTWMQVDEDWQIIGGMCASLEPARTPNE